MATTTPPALWNAGPWTQMYTFCGELGDGGQGYTFHAQRNSDGLAAAVKILRPDRDTDKARRRMLREVTALRTLSKTTARIPKFIESNIDDAIENKSVSPFVAMEYVNGKTLLQAQKDRPVLQLGDACNFANLLLDTVEIAHSEDTTHRDIKPQNILLKNGDYAAPYVIDFGLSFNRVVDQGDLTSIHETIGNRFFRLPEAELTGSDLKHEFASDLSLISGIFFYVLTNEFPEYLSPDEAKSPHRRHINSIQRLHPNSHSFLTQFFDRAFQYDVARRFQSPQELRDRIQRVRDQSEGKLPDIDPLTVALEIRQRLEASNRNYQLDQLENQHGEVLTPFVEYVKQLSRHAQLPPTELNVEASTLGNRQYCGWEVLRRSVVTIIASVAHYETISACRYCVTVKNDELVVVFQEIIGRKPERRGLIKAIEKTSPNMVLTFYNWGAEHNASLRQHFHNWFDRVTRQIVETA